jgi:hypothetical protein
MSREKDKGWMGRQRHFPWVGVLVPVVSVVSGFAAGDVCDESGLTGRGLKPGQPPPFPPPAQENPANTTSSEAKVISLFMPT